MPGCRNLPVVPCKAPGLGWLDWRGFGWTAVQVSRVSSCALEVTPSVPGTSSQLAPLNSPKLQFPLGVPAFSGRPVVTTEA